VMPNTIEAKVENNRAALKWERVIYGFLPIAM